MKYDNVKKLINKRLLENNNKILSDIKVENDFYDVEEIKMNESGLNSIKSMYGNSLINSMFLPVIPINDESFQKKLKKISNEGETDGIGIWRIVKQSYNKTVGLIGFRYYDDEKTKIEVTYCSTLALVIKKMSEEMMKFYFEYLKLDSFYCRTLSYNYYSQIIAISLGCFECSIEFQEKSYPKDSYFTVFKVDKKTYEKIKKNNGGTYKLINISKKSDPKSLHSKARTIKEAIEDFKENNDKLRYDHCYKLFEFLKNRYPTIYK